MSSHAAHESFGAAPYFRQSGLTALAAFSAANTASRRRIACSGVSPDKMSDDGRPDGLAVAAGGESGREPSTTMAAAGGSGAACSAVVATHPLAAMLRASRRVRAFLRLTGVCPNSRLSHNRRASSETATPSLRSPAPIAATDSPARRSRSSSSRCASSCNAFGFFGQRDCATSSVKVSFTVGAISERGGDESGVMRERYAKRSGSAMGAVWEQSKPQGLDVGVLTSWFLLILPRRFGHRRFLYRQWDSFFDQPYFFESVWTVGVVSLRVRIIRRAGRLVVNGR